jgi:hypothetical protein
MSEESVKINYKPLWKLLIDKDMTKICVTLDCSLDDSVEIESREKIK